MRGMGKMQCKILDQYLTSGKYKLVLLNASGVGGGGGGGGRMVTLKT